jgi:two-component system cell cycle response regulator DivK
VRREWWRSNKKSCGALTTKFKEGKMKMKILVAEDDTKNLILMNDILEFKGYHVVAATNGREAVEKAGEILPDLILMDMQMPVMDGFEAVKRLKADKRTQLIPVWALTSYAMPGDEKRILAIGCDGYITKPLDVKLFMERVAKFFNSREI